MDHKTPDPTLNERGGPHTVEKWLKAGKRKQRMLALGIVPVRLSTQISETGLSAGLAPCLRRDRGISAQSVARFASGVKSSGGGGGS